VDTKLRKEYEALHVEIDKAKDIFIKTLKDSTTFTKSESEFYQALIRVKDQAVRRSRNTGETPVLSCAAFRTRQ